MKSIVKLSKEKDYFYHSWFFYAIISVAIGVILIIIFSHIYSLHELYEQPQRVQIIKKENLSNTFYVVVGNENTKSAFKVYDNEYVLVEPGMLLYQISDELSRYPIGAEIFLTFEDAVKALKTVKNEVKLIMITIKVLKYILVVCSILFGIFCLMYKTRETEIKAQIKKHLRNAGYKGNYNFEHLFTYYEWVTELSAWKCDEDEITKYIFLSDITGSDGEDSKLSLNEIFKIHAVDQNDPRVKGQQFEK